MGVCAYNGMICCGMRPRIHWGGGVSAVPRGVSIALLFLFEGSRLGMGVLLGHQEWWQDICGSHWIIFSSYYVFYLHLAETRSIWHWNEETVWNPLSNLRWGLLGHLIPIWIAPSPDRDSWGEVIGCLCPPPTPFPAYTQRNAFPVKIVRAFACCSGVGS